MSDPSGTSPKAAPGVVVIAGAGEGLGYAVGERFARAGHTVVLVARNQEKLDRLVAKIEAIGGRAVAMVSDVRDEDRMARLFEVVESEHGPVEVAIYNAGAQHKKPYLEITGSAFEKVWRLACFGAFLFSREALRHMVPRGRGTILFTAATASVRGGATFGAFAAAKFGTRALIQSIAREFGPQGIHAATVVIDGAIDMPAIHKMMPELVASLPPDGMLAPHAIAETYYQLHCQHRSAWSLEVDVRPYSEKF